jgi:hypothetical protein
LIRDHELVLTADAPLALALNRRTPEARLGEKVQTPRGYAKQGLEVADRREMFHEVLRRTPLSFKQAARQLDRVLRCWEQTADAEAILAHARDTQAARAVVDVVTSLESAHTLREDVTIPADVDLAVIDPDGLSALDQDVLPDEDVYETISPFAPAGRFELGEIELLPSTVAIAETLEAHITPENAGDVGIVLDPASSVASTSGRTSPAGSIPYHTEDELAEHPGLRTFLRVLRTGLQTERLRTEQIHGLLAELGRPTRRRDEAKLVDELDTGPAAELARLWSDLEETTLGEALARFEELAETPRELGELVAELELGEARGTSELLDALEFYLETYPVEHDYSREGVLLASGADNAYVDRPLVFHVGLGTGWAQARTDAPWLTSAVRDRQERQELARFERLLQSGRRRVYLAQDTRRGQPVTPCFFLHELVDEDFERFAELDHTRRRAPAEAGPTGEGFEADPGIVDVDSEPIRTLSSGDLDRLTYCPRDCFMDRLVPTPETVWLRRGRLFHAFAELAAEHPDFVDPTDDAAIAELVDVALDELADLLDPDEVPRARTELRLGFDAIARWLAVNPPEGAVTGYQPPPPERRSPNPFAEHLDTAIDRERAERWFQTHELGLHGMVDLVHAPKRLVDWKSTRSPPSLRRTVERARVDTGEDPPRFQPGVYLLNHRRLHPDRQLTFTFVDVLSERNEALRGDLDLTRITRELGYVPTSFEEHLASRDAYEHAALSSKRRQDVFEEVGYHAYRSYVEDAEPPPTDKDRAETSAFAEGLVDLAKAKRGDLKKAEKAARSAVRRLVDLHDETLYAGDLDRLQRHADAVLHQLADWRTSRFPVPDDVDGDELAHRDLVIRDVTTHRPVEEATRDG